jgi:hypothetical protein
MQTSTESFTVWRSTHTTKKLNIACAPSFPAAAQTMIAEDISRTSARNPRRGPA